MFEIFTDLHIKTCRSLKRRAILKNPKYSFLEEPMFFLLTSKWNLQEKTFFSVKTKINPNFAVNLLVTVYLMNHIFQTSVLIMECIELNCVNIWKRSEAASQPFLCWIEWNTSLSLWVSLIMYIFWTLFWCFYCWIRACSCLSNADICLSLQLIYQTLGFTKP